MLQSVLHDVRDRRNGSWRSQRNVSKHKIRMEQNTLHESQVAQQCYEEMTKHEKKPSMWKANIEKNIGEINIYKTLTERYLAGEILECKNLKETEKCMKGTEEIRKVWATMWNSKMGEDDNRHNEYPEEFIPDSQQHDTFPPEVDIFPVCPNGRL
ncbi:unnamed protein product [Thelazia callipaeda]|uniref:Uncharacterized protein n=1 Tax=Thelazia callipaeda TaxID=103827 RepID=A0A0N5D553_THECL|nr:unnamed protein product [Thelazia callipaeda]